MPLFKKSSPIPPPPPPPPLPSKHNGNNINSDTIHKENGEATPSENTYENVVKTVVGHEALKDCNDIDEVGPGKVEIESKDKPKPPPKSSRLQKALSSGSITLPSFKRRSIRGAKKKDHKRLSTNDIVTEEGSIPNISSTTDSSVQLRETPLWKLPGMELGIKKDHRLSLPAPTRTVPSANGDTTGQNSTLPHTDHCEEESTKSKDFLKRDLPPLPLDQEAEPIEVKEVASYDGKIFEPAIRLRELPPLPQESGDESPPHSHTHIENSPLPPRPVTPAMSEDRSSYSDGLGVSVENVTQLDTSIEDDLTPPPLPKRPDNLTPPNSRKTSQVISSEMALRDAIHKYSGCFPLRIKVLQGYCSDITDVNISTDDVYDIHLVKETKVVSVKSESGMTYRIPLGSPQKVGLIYNPTNDYEKGLNGYVFRTISDITSLPILPKVICATQEARSTDRKYLVEENEVLIVRQVHRTLFKGKKGLKVYSLISKSEKTLPDDCDGYFSTKPSLVRMHLPEIIEYIPKPFPVRAVIYSARENTQLSDQTGKLRVGKFNINFELVEITPGRRAAMYHC